MAKRRVLIVTNRVPYPLNDGGALAMHSMIQGYMNVGWDVAVLSMNTSRHYVAPESLPSLYKHVRFTTFDINTDVKLVPTIRNFFLSRKPNHADRFYDKAFAEKILGIIDDFEPEIIQLESIYLATYLPAIRQATMAKVAIRLHNVEYQIWERLANEAAPIKRYYLKDLCSRIKKFEAGAWAQADLLIAITEQDAELVRKVVPGKKVISIPFGIDVKGFNSKNKNEQWVGYHIGAMDWLPNAEAITWFLDEVWKDLHKEVPEFVFHFAGRNMPGSFEKYEQDGVICAGEVPAAKEFVEDKKILIVPLKSGGGIRVKILEAMALGKLVVSTSVGMQGISAAEPGKHFLLANEKEDFINQVKWALDNKKNALAIADAGAEMVRSEYDLGKIMGRLHTQMLSLLAE